MGVRVLCLLLGVCFPSLRDAGWHPFWTPGSFPEFFAVVRSQLGMGLLRLLFNSAAVKDAVRMMTPLEAFE